MPDEKDEAKGKTEAKADDSKPATTETKPAEPTDDLVER
jgi:hypothetical protein